MRGSGNKAKIATIGAGAALVAAGLVVAPQAFGGTTTAAANCAAVHIIATRASTERPGAGIIGSLVSSVQRASRQTVSTEATDYPAVLNPYGPSVSAGVRALTGQITAKAAACPDTKLVLMGYSQGAHVIGDVLAGSGRQAVSTPNQALDARLAAKVTAVILMGDPRYVAGKSFNAGTSRTNGLFARGNDAALDGFAAKIQSYCDTGDNFCARGASLATHLGYTRKYNTVAQRFVLQRIGG
ncbi:cutinase family protein [Actinoplanes sp. NPDC048796]|uniref:cutinase family protein n=1 Tax=Actinoplanes sp. NPDC048796 TaxID=3155640 RepID=UPI0033E4A08D